MKRGRHRPHKHQTGMGIICFTCYLMQDGYEPRERRVAEFLEKK